MKTVSVKNLTQGVYILEQVEVADMFLQRLKGLLGRNKLLPGQGLLLKPANCIHTIGMKFAIDAAFIDQNGYVLKIIENLLPGRVSHIIKRSSIVIETTAGEFKKNKTEVGDKLYIQEIKIY